MPKRDFDEAMTMNHAALRSWMCRETVPNERLGELLACAIRTRSRDAVILVWTKLQYDEHRSRALVRALAECCRQNDVGVLKLLDTLEGDTLRAAVRDHHDELENWNCWKHAGHEFLQCFACVCSEGFAFMLLRALQSCHNADLLQKCFAVSRSSLASATGACKRQLLVACLKQPLVDSEMLQSILQHVEDGKQRDSALRRLATLQRSA